MSAPSPEAAPASPDRTGRIVISVDAMGGDRGPSAVVSAMVHSARKNPEIAFLVHGDRSVLEPLIARRRVLAGRCTCRHAERTVTMAEKPSHVMRRGEGTSMWAALEAVRAGEAAAAVSCGNTGALMALAMLRLRRLPGITRPAIAVLWPS
ncbi:MAG: phosphate acyltransferase, partial [Rhodobacteraceae bacterium]|nr:phosphate acyltransferase [Paracoccaceae bacterium]